jgi:small subunit ribosomal protein S3
MGQKVHPFGFRLGPLFTWKSRWFAQGPSYKSQMLEDHQLRLFLHQKLLTAGLNLVEIERSINTIKIILFVSRPGVVIGRGGSNLELIKKDITNLLKIDPKDTKGRKVEIKVEEVKNPDVQAQLILDHLKDQLAKRYPHRRAASQALEKATASGAKGIKIIFSGRINGAEIGRTEKYSAGSIPTQTLRADIDYAESPAYTRSGFVGIKVYVYHGERATQ